MENFQYSTFLQKFVFLKIPLAWFFKEERKEQGRKTEVKIERCLLSDKKTYGRLKY